MHDTCSKHIYQCIFCVLYPCAFYSSWCHWFSVCIFTSLHLLLFCLSFTLYSSLNVHSFRAQWAFFKWSERRRYVKYSMSHVSSCAATGRNEMESRRYHLVYVFNLSFTSQNCIESIERWYTWTIYWPTSIYFYFIFSIHFSIHWINVLKVLAFDA